jgi:hypothetical protein
MHDGFMAALNKPCATASSQAGSCSCRFAQNVSPLGYFGFNRYGSFFEIVAMQSYWSIQFVPGAIDLWRRYPYGRNQKSDFLIQVRQRVKYFSCTSNPSSAPSKTERYVGAQIYCGN